MTRRLAVLVLALGACGGDHEAQAPDEADARDDRGAVGGEASETADVGDESERFGVVAPETNACALAPVEVEGAIAWVDARGLWLAPHESASSSTPVMLAPLAEGEGAHDPVVIATGTVRGAILVAVDRAGGAELRAYDRDGAVLWRAAVAEPQALAPVVRGDWIVWPLLTPEGVRYSWRFGATGAEVASFATGHAPRAPLIEVGERLEGGGTHWIVGTDAGVELVRDPISSGRLEDLPDVPPLPGIAARWESDAPVVGLSAIGNDVAVVLETPEGQALQLLHILQTGGAATITPSAAPIPLPDDAHSAPVVFACGAGRAGAWFCPSGATGAVVLGGDGWLGAWSLPGGAELARRALEMNVVTATLGASGWVAGGGTHWLPSGELGWRVALLDPTARDDDDEIASGTGGCPTSPLWDTNGRVSAIVAGPEPVLVRGLVRGPDGPLGMAPGRPRQRGDAHNTTHAVTSAFVCSDGIARGVASARLGDDEIYGLTTSGLSVIVFGVRGERGFVRWLPGEEAARDLVVDDARAVEQAVGLGGGIVAVALRDFEQRVHVRIYGPDGPTKDFVFDSVGAMFALVRTATGELWLGQRAGEVELVHRIDPESGLLETRAFFADDGLGVTRLVRDPRGGGVMVLEDGDGIGVRHLDDSAFPGPVLWWRDGDATKVVTAAGVADDGSVRIGVERVGSKTELLVVRGADVSSVELPNAASALAFSPSGDGLGITIGGLVRVSATGRVGLIRPRPDGERPLPGNPSILWSEVGFTAAFIVEGVGGAEIVWGRADALGFMGCAEVGACALAPADACDAAAPCEPRGCAPATGECTSAEVPACGP